MSLKLYEIHNWIDQCHSKVYRPCNFVELLLEKNIKVQRKQKRKEKKVGLNFILPAIWNFTNEARIVLGVQREVFKGLLSLKPFINPQKFKSIPRKLKEHEI